MKRIFSIIAAFALIQSPLAHAQTNFCLSVQPVVSGIKDRIIKLVTQTDSATVAARTGATLPSLSADSVSIVSDTAICHAAAVAYAAEADSGSTVLPVWVIRVGSTRYVVFNPELGLVSGVQLWIFDNLFHPILALESKGSPAVDSSQRSTVI